MNAAVEVFFKDYNKRLEGTTTSFFQELRIVILGNSGDDKNKVVKSILNCENLSGQKNGLCNIHTSEQAGRRISVVEAPGWDRTSIQQTAENIKVEVERSVSLCPPGPHALLLVIPVKISKEPSTNEITAAQTHMELLSERVWKHTILLFACDEGVGDCAIKAHFQKAKNILDKCKGRSYVLESHAKISELFTKIEDLVEENRGEFFIPQAYYELIQSKTREASGESALRQRRGSLDNPPNLSKTDSEERKETIEAPKHMDSGDINMPQIYQWMGIVGALLGSVAGAEHGVVPPADPSKMLHWAVVHAVHA
ncbi:GTPase IMAP family member 4 [Anabarilius grahami]|uniref:GTPase IMAP family member 4 n=1 Tax=Anabarilius grahami TaxID=495550 RepID=A0A3N0YIJ9_ANAGA|nr:GTPase IMAP family member 4 [Anabarilius grahami]